MEIRVMVFLLAYSDYQSVLTEALNGNEGGKYREK